MSHDSPPTAKQIINENYGAAVWYAANIIGDFCDAQEVVQDAGVVLLVKEQCGEVVLAPLFFGIVRNKALGAGRKKFRRRTHEVLGSDYDTPDDNGNIVPFPSKMADGMTAPPDVVAELPDIVDLCSRMLEWLDAISPNDARIFRLRYEGELSLAETGAQLGITKDAVKCACFRAHLQLQAHFRAAFVELLN